MSDRPVLITGAAGFIGRRLAAYLAEGRARVVGLGHGAWVDAADHGVSRWLNGEVSAENLGQLARDEGAPVEVYHLAGGSSVGAAFAAPREDFKRTVEATAALCDWLRLEAPDAKILAVSSAAVYGAGHDGPIPEDRAGRPYSPYGWHKLMMEQVCRSHAEAFGLQVVTARLFSVYGAGLRKQLLWDATGRLAAGAEALTLGGTGAELRDWTEVSDVVRALALVMGQASAEAPILNIGTGRGTDVATIGRLLVEAWGADVPLRFSGQGRPGDPLSLVAEPSRLEALGFQWRATLEEGIAAYVDWRKRQS